MKNTVLVGMSSAFICLSTMICIPFAVPVTFQIFGIFLAFFILGGKLGAISLLVYLALGFCGLPVFSAFSSGVTALGMPAGGYLIGFALISVMYPILELMFGKKHVLISLCCLAVCYLTEMFFYSAVYLNGINSMNLVLSLVYTVLPYAVFDIFKILLALIVSKRIRAAMR